MVSATITGDTNMSVKRFLSASALLVSSALVPTISAADVDPALKDYEVASGVSGNLSSIGSDTLANLMTLWAEEFKRAYPNVNIQIQAAGSSTAPPALTEGTSSMGPMSRKMKDKEIEAFEARHGYTKTPSAWQSPRGSGEHTTAMRR